VWPPITLKVLPDRVTVPADEDPSPHEIDAEYELIGPGPVASVNVATVIDPVGFRNWAVTGTGDAVIVPSATLAVAFAWPSVFEVSWIVTFGWYEPPSA
jgi:hypothetical protein